MLLSHASPSRGEQGYSCIKCEVTRWSLDKPKGRFGVTFLVRHALLYGVLGGIMIAFSPPKTLSLSKTLLLPIFTSFHQKQKEREDFVCHQRRFKFLVTLVLPPFVVGKHRHPPFSVGKHLLEFTFSRKFFFLRFSCHLNQEISVSPKSFSLAPVHLPSWVSTVKP